MTGLHKRRFKELSDEAEQLEGTRRHESDLSGSTNENVDHERFLAWCVKCRNLLAAACGGSSEHYRAFVEAEECNSWSGNFYNFKRARAVLGAAREDFEGGYLNSVRNLVQAEVFDSELEQAKQLAAAGYISAAAVVAGVVLETTLRGLCASRQLPVGKLDRMNADLAKAGQYNSLVQKQVTALAAVRNSAAHGEQGTFTNRDVDSMIADVERLVGTWLS